MRLSRNKRFEMLKKILVIVLLFLGSFLYANVNVVVSILPQVSITKAIGQDKVNVEVMVKPGNSPHTYEPKPSQMKAITSADLYFSIDVEFEKSWLPKFINQNKIMQVINISQGVEKYKIHNTIDPHIWTTPQNIKILATNIYKSLVEFDSKNKDYYRSNYEKLLLKIENTDIKIKNILSSIPPKTKFMVFHPSWGYFAKQYNLIQLPIEIDGKSPKPRELIYIIKKAKKENIKAIFTAPEFSLKASNQIAKELNIKVIQVSPLNPKWSKNLINLAIAIANK